MCIRDRLYTTPEDALATVEALGLGENGRFMAALTFGNVHGVYKPGNVKLRPEILKPVSYTHLDVYKRQAALTLRLVMGVSTADLARLFLVAEPTMAARLTRARKKLAVAGVAFALPTPEPVSYTHLDVYKRQVLPGQLSLQRNEFGPEAQSLDHGDGPHRPEGPKQFLLEIGVADEEPVGRKLSLIHI